MFKIRFPLFAMCVLATAMIIEVIGSYVSILGLTALFAWDPIVIALAVALDIAKVTNVTLLYTYWSHLGYFMRSYMIAACCVLMIITSVGVFGFLSGKFQGAITETNQDAVILEALQEEQTTLQRRKAEIDEQIAKLPSNAVRGRQTLMKTFEPELIVINARLIEITAEIPKRKVETLHKNRELGPIMYVAEAFDTTPENAVKYVILIIVGVFDPLAVAFLISGNFLLKNHRRFEYERQLEEKKYSNVEAVPSGKKTWFDLAAKSKNETAVVPVLTGTKLEAEREELRAEIEQEKTQEPEKVIEQVDVVPEVVSEEIAVVSESSTSTKPDDIDYSKAENTLHISDGEFASFRGGISARDNETESREQITLAMLRK